MFYLLTVTLAISMCACDCYAYEVFVPISGLQLFLYRHAYIDIVEEYHLPYKLTGNLKRVQTIFELSTQSSF